MPGRSSGAAWKEDWRTLPHPHRADSHHGILRAALPVSFHRALHRQTSVETNPHESLERDEIRHRGERAVLAQRMAGERRALLNESLGPHVFERRFLQYRDGGLGELRGV